MKLGCCARVGFLAIAACALACGGLEGREARGALVGYWSGDGTTADAVGGNSGTLVNGATYGPGRVGQAFSFNGASQYVTVPGAGQYQFGTGDFSIAFFAKFNAINDNSSSLVSKDNFAGGPAYNGWLFNTFGGGGGIGVETRNTGAGADYNTRYATSNFTTGQWYHLAMTREGGVVRLYVDGALRATTTETTPANVSNDQDLRFGALSPASPQYLNGLVDEVRIYDGALTGAQVAALVPEPGTLGLAGVAVLLGLRRRRGLGR